MTDPRVAIVRLRELVAHRHEWDRTDTHEVGELVAALLDSFDGADVVARVAREIALARDSDLYDACRTSEDEDRVLARVALAAAVGGTKP